MVQVRRRVRQIDCVTVKGSQRPMGLFTYDTILERVPLPKHPGYSSSQAAVPPKPHESVNSAFSLNFAQDTLQVSGRLVLCFQGKSGGTNSLLSATS